MARPLLLIVCILQLAIAVAQAPRQYSFKHYSTASGLISNQVNATVQDADGYIWIGSNNGLQRFDCIRYKSFRHNEGATPSLPANQVRQLQTGKKKELWILTVDGKVSRFDTKTFAFTPVTVTCRYQAPLKAILQEKKLIMDEYGNIFLLLPGYELMTYDPARNEFSSQHNFFGLPSSWKVADLIQQPGTHKYWMAIKNMGFAMFNLLNGKWSYAGHNSENERMINQYAKVANPGNLFFDKKRRCWFTVSDDGLPYISCYDLAKNKTELDQYRFVVNESGRYEPHAFFEQTDSTIWVSGIKVFAKYIEKEKQFEQVLDGYEEENSIAYRIISRLSEDREHNIWVGTGNNGLFRFNPSEEFFTNVRHINHLTGQTSDGTPISFIPEKNGTLLVGILGAGLYRYDKDFKEIPLGIKGIPDKNVTPVWRMCASGDSNTIWMSAKNGIYQYDAARRTAKFYNPPVLKGRIIRQLAEDGKGNLWLGTDSGGVYKWNRARKGEMVSSKISAYTAVKSIRINSIVIDRKGFIWIGTFAEGAYVIDPGTDKVVMHFSDKVAGEFKLPEQSVTSILEYNDSLMCIGTSTRVVLYNRLFHKTSLLGNTESLSGFVASMEKDNAGHLWISTTAALCRYTLQNKVSVQFNREDGLSNDYFVLAASHTLPGGKMLFGASAWMIVFEPGKIKLDTSSPDIELTDFKVMNRSLRVDSLLQQKIIALAPDENSLTIDLSTFSYNTNYVLQYKLEGLNKEWSVADPSQQLVYSYLPPGNYTLVVNSIDTDGNTGKKPLKLAIKIYPPFYMTWWFFSLLALAMTGGLLWLDKERMKRKLAIQRVRSDIAGNLHREVNTALNNISILSEVAKLKADRDIERAKEYIQQINTKSRHMIVSLDDMLWSIDPANDNMQKITERIREYIDGLNNRYNASIQMQVDTKVATLQLDMQLRHDALLLFKDAIDVLIQSGVRSCQLQIGYERANILYTIGFVYDGIDATQLNNLLYSQEMEKRIKAANATLNLDRNLLQLKIPLG